MKCPICHKKVETYFESSCPPFLHTDPHKDLAIYGPYSTSEEVQCISPDLIHFEFQYPVNEHRLVRCNCPEDKLDIAI